MIETNTLTKSFGDTKALDGLSFALPEEADTLAIIGPSGGGKSTFLRVLAGLEEPDSGSATLLGRKLPEPGCPEAKLITWRRDIGFLFQAHHLFPHLTARENIALPLRAAHGHAPDAADARADELLERFGLGGLGDRAPSALSGGQRQRVALSRALAHHPKVLFLDEPTAALDPIRTTEVLEVIGELRAAGQRIILSTHEMNVARHAASHLVFLSQGEAADCGETETLLTNPGHPVLRDFLNAAKKNG